MQAHGGQIQAFNRPDGGSGFRITVPASAVQNQGDGAAAA
jgi:signal transduction histidine kinase